MNNLHGGGSEVLLGVAREVFKAFAMDIIQEEAEQDGIAQFLDGLLRLVVGPELIQVVGITDKYLLQMLQEGSGLGGHGSVKLPASLGKKMLGEEALVLKVVHLDGGGTLDGLLIVLQCGHAHEIDVVVSTFWDVRHILVTILRELQDTMETLVDVSVCGEHGCLQLVKQPCHC